MDTLYRFDMIQECINVVKQRKRKVNYVEIGVQTGYCFFKIKSDTKLAVDPKFIIKTTRKIKAYIKNPANFNNEFFELTSDDFFAEKKEYLKKIGGIDVIFIDGLHLYEQVTKDIENALEYLNPGGFILVHDCNPLSETAAVRAYTSEEVAAMNLPGWNNIWNGDGWKSIVEIRSKRKDIEVNVYNTDHGVGVITKGTPDSVLNFTSDEINKLTYNDLDKNRELFLNLKNPSDFWDFISEKIKKA